MRRLTLGWAAITLGTALGCQSSPRTSYADNPLLMSREPLVQNGGKQYAAHPSGGWSRQATPPGQPANLSRATSIYPPPAATPGKPMQVTSMPKASAPPAALSPRIDVAKPAEKPVAVAEAEPKVEKSADLFNAATPKPAPMFEAAPPLPAPAPLEPPAASGPAISPPAIKQMSASVVIPAPKSRLDRAADYCWLQGEVDCHYRGYKELRFRSPAEDEAIGGKVRLVDDPRLAELKDGDLILVEGELLKDLASAGSYPRYQVRSVKVVERRSPSR